MSETVDYVKSLSDDELYNELRERGFPAGPVVASTRSLYKRKLTQILEGFLVADEQTPSQQNDVGEGLTQPKQVNEKPSFRHDSKSGDTRVRTSPSYSHGDERLEKSSSSLSNTHTFQRAERRYDGVSPQSPRSSSYLNTVRGLKNNDIDKPSPSWMSVDSPLAQPATSSPWKTYGSSKDDPHRKPEFGIPRRTTFSQETEESPGYSARQRWSSSDASPAARQEMASRYRFPGYSDGKSSVLNRYNPERQRKQSRSLTVRVTLFITLVLAALALAYMLYRAWYENDPYQQIEQDVMKIIEGSKSKDSRK